MVPRYEALELERLIDYERSLSWSFMGDARERIKPLQYKIWLVKKEQKRMRRLRVDGNPVSTTCIDGARRWMGTRALNLNLAICSQKSRFSAK